MNVAAMTDGNDHDHELGVLDGVDDAVIALADAGEVLVPLRFSFPGAPAATELRNHSSEAMNRVAYA
jgi:hypothetical protein